MLPFRETELFILRLTHKYAYEFSKLDASRVIGFYPIPQHMAHIIVLVNAIFAYNLKRLNI
jgi:hypothetical protein